MKDTETWMSCHECHYLVKVFQGVHLESLSREKDVEWDWWGETRPRWHGLLIHKGCQELKIHGDVTTTDPMTPMICLRCIVWLSFPCVFQKVIVSKIIVLTWSPYCVGDKSYFIMLINHVYKDDCSVCSLYLLGVFLLSLCDLLQIKD